MATPRVARPPETVRSKKISPDGYSLWLVRAHLSAGSTIDFPPVHGDEAVYVVSGAVTLEGRRSQAGGAVIVESGVECRIEAVGATEIVHVGAAAVAAPANGPLGPPAPDGHGVHVFGPNGRDESRRGDDVLSHWFADGTCPRCRIQLFRVQHDHANREAGVGHSHSQDEIIHVLAGSIRLGRRTCGPGSSVCVPAHRRYALHPASASHTFLNYRAGVSSLTRSRDDEPYLETAEVARALTSTLKDHKDREDKHLGGKR